MSVEPLIKMIYFKFYTLTSNILSLERSDGRKFSSHLGNFLKFTLLEKTRKT